MPAHRSKAKLANRLLIAGAGLLLVAVGILVVSLKGPQRALRTPSGCIISLERYHFMAGVVRYYLLDDRRDRTVPRELANGLPQPVSQLLKRILPEPKAHMSPPFPGEPFLSVGFSTQAPIQNGSRGPNPTVSRVVISDDLGQSFDGVINYMGNSSILSVEAFPRRGKELHLRPMLMGDDSGVVFKIPNPCPGPHPVWNAEPLPIDATNSSRHVTLESFLADRTQARTRCVLRVRQSGLDSNAWKPASFEISDATGNHWKPPIDQVRSTNGMFYCSFFGALWPGEDAWKVRVEFKPGTKQSEDGKPWAVEFLAKPNQVNDGLAPR